ncbi:lipopolysaccharide biosynthesis protein [Xylanimonas ulmi]|uniref:lipopolysaccharide biosynthesis protein n=1 Tax=Xylanimonas ulmi TaxID=228973 RepID=UPI00102B37B8|nr:hypothetical protein [Xylanibacterium ulmi]
MWFTFQPTAISFVITRTLGASETGQFAYAVAQAYLFWGIGIYGMRRYQASDVEFRFTFGEYLGSRVVTTAAMILAGLGFAAWSIVRDPGSADTMALVLLVLALRAVDSLEDVYLGYFQQMGRLDIGSKVSAYRSIASTIVIMLALQATHDMPLAIGLGVVVSVVLLAVMLPQAFVRPLTPQERALTSARLWRLLSACAPLFVATFVSIYVANAPRYAINAALDLEAQGFFSWLSLAPFLITLLSMVIYNPVITRMAVQWTTGDLRTFVSWTRRLSMLIGGVTVVTTAAGLLLGVPVLNAITGWDFGPYRTELVVLLLAGGLSAWGGLYSTVLTIVRRQGWFTVGVVAAAAVGLTGGAWVRHGGLLGASWLYVALFAVQCAVFGAALQTVVRRRRLEGTSRA